MKRAKIMEFIPNKKKFKKFNIKANKKRNYRMIGIVLLIIIVILLLIFNNLKLYIDTKLLKKEIELLNREKKLLINDTIKLNTDKINLEKDREIFEKYKFEKEYKFYRQLCPKEVIGKKKVLYGEPRDGAYVLLDDLSDIKIAYSFGISNIIHFDKALADKGIDVYMYDYTVNGLPYENTKFHFKKIGITCEYKKSSNMKTLIDIMKENGHLEEKNMILKMDIEGNEWEVLQEITPDILNKFKYITMELHISDSKINENYDL